MLRAAGPQISPRFIEVVENVRSGHPDGLAQLYKVFGILSASLRLQMGFNDFDDRVHDIFIVVVKAIRDGKLRDPGALSAYIHGIAKRALWTDLAMRKRRDRISESFRQWTITKGHNDTPEESLSDQEKSQFVGDMLGTLSLKERDILTRFYLYEQPKEQICRELDLTSTQFRLSKSRATQRLRGLPEQYPFLEGARAQPRSNPSRLVITRLH